METRYFITGDSAESIEDAKKVTVAQALNEQNKRITALATSKQDVLTAGDNITISPENVISASSGDIVIYDNENGAISIEGIALEIGAVYEIFITSAVNSMTDKPFGQQKITIKLITTELFPNTYDVYINVNWLDVDGNVLYNVIIKTYKQDTELWTVESDTSFIKIYKIIKKAV